MEGRGLQVLQILRAPVGGLFRHVIDLTQGLAARGHELGIVVDSLASDAQTKGKLEALAPFAALGIHTLPIPQVFGASDLSTLRRVRRLADELDIDIIHGHGAKGGFNARLARLGNGKRRALYTPHGGVLHFAGDSAKGQIFRRIERVMLGLTDGIIFESAFAQATFHQAIGVPKHRQAIVYNGLAPAEFVPVADDAELHDFAFVGEFRDLKGIKYLLDALVGLKRSDGRPATLIMAGGGPDFAATKERIAASGLGGRVKLAGVRPAREIFAKGRCVVVPSLAESLPYVVMEAIAAARPVIATRVGGIAEIFGPTSDLLVPPADMDALRSAMQDFLDRPEAAEARMQEQLAHVSAHFSLETMIDGIERIYRGVLRER